MKKTNIIKILSAVLLAIVLLPVLSVCVFADGEEPQIKFSVSSSDSTNGERKVEGSGELHSSSVVNQFNIFVSYNVRNTKISMRLTKNGETTEVPTKYHTVSCEKEEDYGTLSVDVLINGEIKGHYDVELIYDGEDSGIVKWFKNFKRDFYRAFIENNNYTLILSGLGYTLAITFFSLIIGIVIGTIVAAIRSTYDKNEEVYKLHGGAGAVLMRVLNAICKFYLTVIRGTPVVVQLLIIYFIIFSGGTNDIIVAVTAFGINSGAYVAEILRGGIMSVDSGQFEAGRSLGFNYIQTMRYIIIPQMFKSSLPALCNEFITLLKETSVAGYVPITELTKAGNIIRNNTYIAFMPLIAVALIYLTMVIILTKLVSILERRLRRSDR